MKVKQEKLEKNLVALEVEVEAEKFSDALDKAYRKLVQKVNVPGFRKGKAPKALVEQRVGKPYIVEEALDILLPEAYYDAVQESKIEPIDRPEVEVLQAEEGQPVVFKATVPVKPEVTLGQYEGVEIEKPDTEVTAEQIESELKNMQQRHAQITTLDENEPAQQNDTMTLDFEGFVDGEPFPGGTGNDYPLELGSNTFIPGFEEQLVGVKTGAEKDVNVKFPDDYHAAELAGKDAIFKVKVKNVKRKEVAELDDEFAKDISEFATLEELKQDIANKLKEAAEKRAEQVIRGTVVKKVVENAAVEIPDVLVEQRVDNAIRNMAQRLNMQGLKLEDYLKYTKQSIDELREQHRPEAEQAVKTDLVIDSVAKALNIEVSGEEVEAEIAKLAEKYNQEPSAMKSFLDSQGNLEGFKDNIVFDKTIDYLIEKSNMA